MHFLLTFFTLFFSLIINSNFFTCNALTCYDDWGKAVDWHISYKLPKLKSTNIHIDNGTGYVYLGENDMEWKLSNKAINGNDTSFGFTLSPIYDKIKSKISFYILYNDEDPHGPVSLYRGHTKGVIAFDNSSGFWLIHSVPKYPSYTKDNYNYPESGQVYGQSFLCITLNSTQIGNLSSLLYYNDPCVYDFYLPDEIANKYPLLEAITKEKHIPKSPWNETLMLKTINDISFLAFAKYKNFDKDIYSSWLAPYLNSDLYTETWQNGHGKLPSACNDKWTVENIQDISFSIHNISFKSTQDHSKFAVSNGQFPWTCIGDINRMEPQKRRGGGTICIYSTTIWKNFHQLVTKVENCP